VTTLRARSGPRTLLAALASLGLLAALAVPSLAASVEPTVIEGPGNSSCGQLGDYAFEFKINIENPDGTFKQGDPGVEVTPNDPTDFEVTITFHAATKTIDFEANYLVEAVFLKGGVNGSHLYEYNPGVLADTGLHVPGNSDISHVSFCYATQPGETPTPTPTPDEPTPTPTPDEPTPTPTPDEPTPTPTPDEEESPAEETPTPTPREDVAGGTPTATPAGGTLPDTTTGTSSQVPAMVLSLFLMASLASMAYLRLARQR
jgi:hypothetical protein